MSKKETNEVRIHNIHLKTFIDHLTEIYEMGGEIIDLVGVLDEKQDSLGIIVYGEALKETKKKKDSLTKDLLKQLYNGVN